jgi:glucose/arabinose dehydrogenase
MESIMTRDSVLDRFIVSFVACLSVLAVCFEIKAATLPTGFTETQVATGLSNATAMEFAPDGRLFVCQQSGELRVVKNGILLSTPFLSVAVDSSGERGLLGVAFDPNFPTNKFVYVYYTNGTLSPRHNQVSRFTANGDVAVANSEVVILTLDNLSSATNHNGGAIHFGPDGKLYVAVGENANGANSQTLSNRLGKILRINSDGSIPADNPFFNTAAGLNKSIWSLGLRNPFTFAFQQNTSRMFINDVGQSTWEEINDGIAGSNYGWPTTEGPTTNPSFRAPIFAYGRSPSDTGGCAITGGAFYNPVTTQFPTTYVGKYFFADFCSGWIRLLDPATNTATGFATGINSPVDLRVAADGSLYYLARGVGTVIRIQYPPNQQPPSITTPPSNQNVNEGQPATFSVTAAGTAPLAYQWQRNTANISGANSPAYTISSATPADNGAKFRCVVSNAFGTATSNEATLTVTPPPPTLMTEVSSDRAIAFDSVTMMRDPFPLNTTFNFSSDHRTRIILLAANADLLPGENSSALTAQAEDSILMVYPLTVEFVGKVPGYDWLTEIVVKLPESISGNGDLLVNVTLRGRVSNKVRIKIQ